jgi:hypothetical protein
METPKILIFSGSSNSNSTFSEISDRLMAIIYDAKMHKEQYYTIQLDMTLTL